MRKAQHGTLKNVLHTGDVDEVLRGLRGKQVAVYIGGWPRSEFKLSCSISGALEAKPVSASSPAFRVLVNEGTYSYFDASDVRAVVIHPKTFRDGSKAVVLLNSIDSRFDFEEFLEQEG